jgi:hypothetical protein
MNDTPQSNASTTPRLLAKLSWQLWAVAIGIIIFTRGLSIKVPAETCALLLICGGFLLGIVMLIAIPKYGAKDILKPTLAGIALNALMLSIAIPNFIHARSESIRKNEALIKAPLNWQQYEVAGLQFLSPVGLTNVNGSAKEAPSKTKTYMGQLWPSALTLMLHRRTLSADDGYTLENFSSEVVDLMQQKLPEGFQSNIRDGVIDGIPSKQLSVQYQRLGKTVKDSVLIFEKQPFIWEVQVWAPESFPNLDETAGEILNSVKIIP